MPSTDNLRTTIAAMDDESLVSRLRQGIYRDIGMAAVAEGLSLEPAKLDPDARLSIKRGERYLFLLPANAARAAQRRTN